MAAAVPGRGSQRGREQQHRRAPDGVTGSAGVGRDGDGVRQGDDGGAEGEVAPRAPAGQRVRQDQYDGRRVQHHRRGAEDCRSDVPGQHGTEAEHDGEQRPGTPDEHGRRQGAPTPSATGGDGRSGRATTSATAATRTTPAVTRSCGTVRDGPGMAHSPHGDRSALRTPSA